MKELAQSLPVLVAILLLGSSPAFAQGLVTQGAWAFLNRAGDYGNNEAQCYDPNQVAAGGGQLTITLTNQSKTCKDSVHSPSSFNYRSGMVQWTSFKFTYGSVEVKAKLGRGWPAIWMLGANCQVSNVSSADNIGSCNWPQPGSDEIEIAEFTDGDGYTANSQNMFVSSGGQACAQTLPSGNAISGFHVYSMTWTPSQVSYAIDGVAGPCTHTRDVPSHPMFLIINDAVSSSNDSIPSSFPQVTTVQYVKVCSAPCNGSNTIFYDDFTNLPPRSGCCGCP